ncbi:MAG: GyrI-like domain-containing protein [Anaerolineales bacterium]|jgi:DNA gyrase inhibitor GyrI
MDKNEVRIVRLEPMQVASFYGFSETPEIDAHQQANAWLEEIGLLDQPDAYRSFGFNNPDPTPGSPKYGYEIWITVEEGMDVGEDVKTKEFTGGLYGVMDCNGIETIGKDWKHLLAWRETSHYKPGSHQWLEELLTKSPQAQETDYRFYLYIPLVE